VKFTVSESNSDLKEGDVFRISEGPAFYLVIESCRVVRLTDNRLFTLGDFHSNKLQIARTTELIVRF
jgi:hypothetical protein